MFYARDTSLTYDLVNSQILRTSRYCSEEQNSEPLLTTRDGPRARQKAEQRGLDRAVVLAHEGCGPIQSL